MNDLESLKDGEPDKENATSESKVRMYNYSILGGSLQSFVWLDENLINKLVFKPGKQNETFR